jgi:hypothetical protein
VRAKPASLLGLPRFAAFLTTAEALQINHLDDIDKPAPAAWRCKTTRGAVVDVRTRMDAGFADD